MGKKKNKIDFNDPAQRAEFIKEFANYFNESAEENRNVHDKSYLSELEALNKITAQFYLLSLYIRKPSKNDAYPGRYYFGRIYLSNISANIYTIKELFANGLHIQFQILLRSQIEFINNCISYIGDDDFYKRFGTSDKLGNIITPKPIHAENAIKRILKVQHGDSYKDVWLGFKEIMNEFYNNLSETAHGNIVKIVIQSMEDSGSKSDHVVPPKYGRKKPVPYVESVMHQAINYFQITYAIIYILLKEKNMLESKHTFSDFIKSNVGQTKIYGYDDQTEKD